MAVSGRPGDPGRAAAPASCARPMPMRGSARSTSRPRDAAPGVVAVVTGRELAEWTTPLSPGTTDRGACSPTAMTTLPIDKVRFQGDPIACVVAPTAIWPRTPPSWSNRLRGAPPVPASRPRWPRARRWSTTPCRPTWSRISMQCSATLRGQFARAHRMVEACFAQARQTHLPIEARGCAAVWDQGRQHLTVHIGSQVPHPLRTQLAGRLRLKESQVTVISPDVGGGFGQKIALYREELTVAALARHLKRPVRWREDRMENLVASAHARETTVGPAPRSAPRAWCWRSRPTSSRISAPTASTRPTTSCAWSR